MSSQYRPAILALALVATTGLAACGTINRSLAPIVPDEFRVVARAPLVIPPEYSLRPPAPGEPRPQELQPESTARTAMLGANINRKATEGERLLLTKAGAGTADPLIKFMVDDQFGDIAYKEKDFADKVMFWRAPQTAATASASASGATTATPLDAEAEAKRLQALTGGKPVVIVRAPEQVRRRFKLPGL